MLFQSILCLTALLLRPTTADSPLPPSDDPFYQPPADFESHDSGTILRSRKLPGIAAKVNVESAYQLLYRTVDSLLNASVAVTTVLIPPSANFSQLVSYQTYYDQPVPNCAPSYGLQAGASDTTGVGEVEGVAPNFLSRGMVVSTADYEGEAAAFTAGPQAGYATLDSIRAVLASGYITGVQSTADTAMFGYSGGSLATEYACELQPDYAPELSNNIIGAAAGGLPVNLTTSMLANNGTGNAGLTFASLQGLANGYPEFAACLEEDLFPSMAAAFHRVHSDCGYFSTFANQNMFSYLKDGDQFVYNSCWGNIANAAGAMGHHGTPKIPLYVFQGTADEIVPSIEQADALIEEYCGLGAQITYVRYVGATHEGAKRGAGFAYDFLFNLFGGGSAPAGCNTTNIN